MIQLFNLLQQTIADLQTKLMDAQAALEIEKKLSYDQGFADGVASVPVQEVSDKIYSQAEFDAKLAEGLSALQLELEGVKAQFESLKGSVDAQIKAAVDAKLMELKAAYDNMLVIENQAETGFGDMLKVAEIIIIDEPAPVEETPVEETPVEETPVEETPVEETPVETPVEEIPAEEIPAEDDDMGNDETAGGDVASGTSGTF